jgi:hypothetical protein
MRRAQIRGGFDQKWRKIGVIEEPMNASQSGEFASNFTDSVIVWISQIVSVCSRWTIQIIVPNRRVWHDRDIYIRDQYRGWSEQRANIRAYLEKLKL